MKVVTSMGYEYVVEWIDTPITDKNRLLLHMKGERPLSEIVAEFDGLEWLERYDEAEGNKRFEGFTRLSMARIDNGNVTIAMERGETV